MRTAVPSWACLALVCACARADGGAGELPFDYCDGVPPDAACYAAKRDPDSASVATAVAIADRHVQLHPAIEQPWGWRSAVLMFGIGELYRVTGEARYLAYVRAWMDHHIDAGYVIATSDTCAPVASAALLWAETGDAKYLEPLDDARIYLAEAARTEAGGLSHHGTRPIQASLWVDSLFMLGSVVTRWGEAAEDQGLLDEYTAQFRIFTAALQADDGLYAHTFGWPMVDTSLYWGRGNGWVTAAGYDHLRAQVIRGQVDPEVQAALADQVAAILAAQDPGGLWWIVLNHPGEGELETSSSALLTYGMARGFRYGLLDAELVLPAIDAAVAGLETKIVADASGLPVVTDISGPTVPGDLDGYLAVELQDDLSYGVGAVILALIETSGLP